MSPTPPRPIGSVCNDEAQRPLVKGLLAQAAKLLIPGEARGPVKKGLWSTLVRFIEAVTAVQRNCDGYNIRLTAEDRTDAPDQRDTASR
jgi:hypothetical protein